MTQRSIIDALWGSLIAVAFAAAPISTASAAERGRSHHDWAKVVSSKPVYDAVRIVTPRTQCWTERVAYEHHYHGARSPAPMIIGATFGGLLGHEIGHKGRSKRVGTVVGALLGGTIGHEIGRERRGRASDVRREYRDEERCETSEEVTWENALRGYDVTYRYHGRSYETQLAHDPGDRIRVKIDVIPAH
jgi:uncharacterized protein YcfJ